MTTGSQSKIPNPKSKIVRPHSQRPFALGSAVTAMILLTITALGCQSPEPTGERPFKPPPDRVIRAAPSAARGQGQEGEEEESPERFVALRAVGMYLAGRGLDFADIFEARAGFGLGLFAGVQVSLLSTGIGADAMRRYGFDGRDIGVWSETEIGLPFNFFATSEQNRASVVAPVWRLASARLADEHMAGPPGEQALSVSGFLAQFRPADPQPVSPPGRPAGTGRGGSTPLIRKFDVTASLAVLLLGAKAGIHLGEFVDFLAGFLTIDLARDDPR